MYVCMYVCMNVCTLYVCSSGTECMLYLATHAILNTLGLSDRVLSMEYVDIRLFPCDAILDCAVAGRSLGPVKGCAGSTQYWVTFAHTSISCEQSNLFPGHISILTYAWVIQCNAVKALRRRNGWERAHEAYEYHTRMPLRHMYYSCTTAAVD